MSKVKVVLLISALASLTGCASVVSLHPLALPNGKEIVFDPALLGTWEDVKSEADTTTRYTVARAESGYRYTRYTVARAESGSSVLAVPNESKGTMHLMKVGDRNLLDVYCPSDGPPPPVHYFVKLRLEKDTAWVAGMDSGWLKEQIKTRGQLRHEVLAEDEDRVVLTASPAELHRYLLPYVAERKSFGKEAEMRRIK